ncbi:MAG: hypothetical protein ACX932_06445 [Gammaproteobacteria bacterium]
MAKQFFYLSLTSLIILLLSNYVAIGFHGLFWLKSSLQYAMQPVISNTAAGSLIKRLFILLLVPITTVAIPSMGYFLIKRKRLPLPYFRQLLWSTWLIMLTTLFSRPL